MAYLINNKSNLNALNYGVSATGPLLSLAIIKEYGEYFKPTDIFYLFYEGNDLTDMMHEKVFLINYLKDDNFNQNLIGNSQQLKDFFQEYEKIFYEIIEYNKINSSEVKNTAIKKNTKNLKKK